MNWRVKCRDIDGVEFALEIEGKEVAWTSRCLIIRRDLYPQEQLIIPSRYVVGVKSVKIEGEGQ